MKTALKRWPPTVKSPRLPNTKTRKGTVKPAPLYRKRRRTPVPMRK